MKKCSFYTLLSFAAFLAVLSACGDGEIVDLSNGSSEYREIMGSDGPLGNLTEKGAFIDYCADKKDNDECVKLYEEPVGLSSSSEPDPEPDPDSSSSSAEIVDPELSSSSAIVQSSSSTAVVLSSSSNVIITPSSSSRLSSSSVASSSSNTIITQSSSSRLSSSSRPSSSSNTVVTQSSSSQTPTVQSSSSVGGGGTPIELNFTSSAWQEMTPGATYIIKNIAVSDGSLAPNFRCKQSASVNTTYVVGTFNNSTDMQVGTYANPGTDIAPKEAATINKIFVIKSDKGGASGTISCGFAY